MAFENDDVRFDFFADWAEQVGNELRARDYQRIPTGFDELTMALFNAQLRHVDQRPRRVHIAPDLSVPEEHREGFRNITEALENGQDTTPFHSKLVLNAAYRDPLLNDWGIHHFHLGAKLVPNSRFVSRTGPLVFLRVREDAAYVIAIGTHGSFTDKELLEKLNAHWPDLLTPYVLQGVLGDNDVDTKVIRNKRANRLLTLADGRVVGPPGGGVTSAGTGLPEVMQLTKVKHALAAREADAKDRYVRWLSDPKLAGLLPPAPVRLKLVVDDGWKAIIVLLGRDGAPVAKWQGLPNLL